jgi:dihydrofolate synthase/folylpolyglutamate synthase
VLLFGIMADKNVEEVTRLLFPLARRIVLTRSRAGRAVPTIEIVKRSGGLAASARRQARPRKALALARSLARPREPLVVAGSLYLVGEVKRILGPSPPG